jgi:hypothetical protein
VKITRQQLEQLQRELVSYAIHRLGVDVGVTLFVSPFGQHENLAYISNVDRASMIATVKEWLARIESGLDTDPAGPRAKS